MEGSDLCAAPVHVRLEEHGVVMAPCPMAHIPGPCHVRDGRPCHMASQISLAAASRSNFARGTVRFGAGHASRGWADHTNHLAKRTSAEGPIPTRVNVRRHLEGLRLHAAAAWKIIASAARAFRKLSLFQVSG